FAVNGSSVSIVAHVTGRTLDLDQVADEILKGRRVVAGRLHEEEPDRTTEDLEALKVTELVSTFTSNYPAGQPRVTNIHRASELVNGTLVMPGETFSLNQEIGRRTAENGFVRAPVIYAGEFTEDLGGGVSQFATTMFNAAFFGGYPLLEYQAHTFYISRYPMGREATLSWPKPDLKFRNDTDSAIYIRSSVSATSVTVSFYGTKTRDVRAEGPEVLSVIPIPEEYKVDGALPRGQRRIEEAGSEGRVVRVTRVITRDGDEIGRKSYTTRYRPQKRIVVVHPCDHPDPAQRPPAEQCVPPEETTTTTAPGATTTTAAPAGG
ncbi:MAG TPA: VanW family protein, partial [Acidimicrobiia bacterium]|nr:VanW family protein [Acidimicrobiia bacterium]